MARVSMKGTELELISCALLVGTGSNSHSWISSPVSCGKFWEVWKNFSYVFSILMLIKHKALVIAQVAGGG